MADVEILGRPQYRSRKLQDEEQNLSDKSVLTGREVVQRIKDKEIQRKQFEEAVEFEVRNNRGKR